MYNTACCSRSILLTTVKTTGPASKDAAKLTGTTTPKVRAASKNSKGQVSREKLPPITLKVDSPIIKTY